MRCAVSFLTVVVLSSAVGVMALLIIWLTESKGNCDILENEDEFRCLDTGKCLKPSQFCDKIAHCPDGADESPMFCEDLTTLIDHIRVMLSHKLPVCSTGYSGNVTSEIDEETLKRLRHQTRKNGLEKEPEICGFLWINKSMPSIGVKCHGKTMNETLDNIPWNEFDQNSLTISLDHGALNTSLLTRPPENVTQFLLLQRFYITHNYIEAVDDKVFCNFPSIEQLFISDNKLQNLSADAFCTLPRLRVLHLNDNRLHLRGFDFKNMPHLRSLTLEQNEIEEITEYTFGMLHNLQMLNLSHNRIKVIHEKAFRNNTCLKELDLSHNQLHRLPPTLFHSLEYLKKLYITSNPKVYVPYPLFKDLKNLTSLNIETLDITQFNLKNFEFTPNLDLIYFKKFSYCKFLPRARRCFPYSDGLSSNSNLLIGQSRVTVWLVGILTLLGNISVLVNRWIFRRKRTSTRSEIGEILNIFVSNLAIADLLMGVYLVVLACKDVEFRGVYSVKAYEWGTSILCSVIGVLALVSSEVSLLILTIMSLERYLTIGCPFSSTHILNKHLTRASMIVIWIFVCILALAPAIQWRSTGSTGFYGSTGLCFPIHLDERYPVGWQYTTFVFIGVNSCCLILITLSYSLLYYTVRNTQRRTPNMKKNIELASRFFLMVFTDVLCWAPIIILKGLVLGGYILSQELIGWTVIYILPLNSAVNPILYTFSTKDVRRAIKSHLNGLFDNMELNRMAPTTQGNNSMELQNRSRSILFGGSRTITKRKEDEQPNTAGTEDTELTHSVCPTVSAQEGKSWYSS